MSKNAARITAGVVRLRVAVAAGGSAWVRLESTVRRRRVVASVALPGLQGCWLPWQSAWVCNEGARTRDRRVNTVQAAILTLMDLTLAKVSKNRCLVSSQLLTSSQVVNHLTTVAIEERQGQKRGDQGDNTWKN